MYSIFEDISSRSLCFFALASIAVWYISSSLFAWYRLRGIPGPAFSTAFSYFWLARTTLSGRQHWVYRELNKKYGPLVKIGPNEILTDDPEIIKKVNSPRNGYSRDAWYTAGRFNPYHDNLITLLDNKEHTKSKSKMIAGYSGREVADFEPGINSQVEALLHLLRHKYIATPAKPNPSYLDLSLVTNYFTLDVITRLGFGHEIGYLRDDTDHFNFLHIIRALWPMLSTSANIPILRKFFYSTLFLKLLGPKTTDKSGSGALMGMVKPFVDKRFGQDSKEEQDILGSFIRHGLSQQECEAETIFMIFGGTESTSSVMRSILSHTMTTPSVYYKIKEEIRLAVTEGRVSSPISFEEAKRLPYLQAIIYEGIRMRPPIIGLFSKIVPAGGDEFHGSFIPAGTCICTNMSSLLHSPVLFGNQPESFRPERFMELDNAKRGEMERNTELAFGYGQFMCVGKTVAFSSLYKVIFELLRAFDFQMVSPMNPCKVETYGVFIEEDLLVSVKESSFLAN